MDLEKGSSFMNDAEDPNMQLGKISTHVKGVPRSDVSAETKCLQCQPPKRSCDSGGYVKCP